MQICCFAWHLAPVPVISSGGHMTNCHSPQLYHGNMGVLHQAPASTFTLQIIQCGTTGVKAPLQLVLLCA